MSMSAEHLSKFAAVLQRLHMSETLMSRITNPKQTNKQTNKKRIFNSPETLS